nr:MAG TPA: hypothetical protein [Caudoviricetes sp.]
MPRSGYLRGSRMILEEMTYILHVIIAITVRKSNEDTMMFSGDPCENMYFLFLYLFKKDDLDET